MTIRSLAPKALGAAFLFALIGAACVHAPAPAAEPTAVHALSQVVSSAAETTYEYSVWVRDRDATDGKWRKWVDWTTDYDYAVQCYNSYVNQNYDEVRLYKRGVR